MVSREFIRSCYLAFLSREPESDAELDRKAQGLATVEDAMKDFIASKEFRASVPEFFYQLWKGIASPPLPVQVKTSPPELQAMFDRTRKQWTKLGDEEPYWSVLTDDRFRRNNVEANMAAFDDSGRSSAALLDRASARVGTKLQGTCLEFGCGVGRVTRYLAERFEKVIGVDISEGNLEICRKRMADAKVTNVELRLLTTPAEVATLPDFDFFYSIIVLQHNPPPVMQFMLTNLLGKVKAGGGAYFQVPTHSPGYAFNVADFLKTPVTELDMHVLPMPDVFASIHDNGMRPVEVLMDDSTGMYGSHTFYAVKPT